MWHVRLVCLLLNYMFQHFNHNGQDSSNKLLLLPSKKLDTQLRRYEENKCHPNANVITPSEPNEFAKRRRDLGLCDDVGWLHRQKLSIVIVEYVTFRLLS